jgi:hypothetical protein
MQTIDTFDLALAIDCEYDWDFIRLIEKEAHQMSLTCYIIWPDNIEETFENLKSENLKFLFLYDRASDTSQKFRLVYDLVLDRGGKILDRWENIQWASDKATMHLEFLKKNIPTPYTIIIPSFGSEEEFCLTTGELASLGRPFIIKPANTTGGGIGVVDGAETLQDIRQVRQEYSEDKYLLQEKIQPMEKEGKRFWFRCFYSCGLVQCAWWGDLTHRYEKLNDEEIQRYNLYPLFFLVEKIANTCKLNFFSTEIVQTFDNLFLVIDYVNEICDMRLQSRYYDGVLDEIVENVAAEIVKYAKHVT